MNTNNWIFCTFEWLRGSINDNVSKYCIDHSIKYEYNHFGALMVFVYNMWWKIDYKVNDNKTTTIITLTI